VVINGLDLTIWRPLWEPASRAAGAALRRSFGIPAGAPLLLSVGSLTPVKGHSFLLPAMDHLRGRYPNMRLLILGEGFLRAELETQRHHLGLDDIVLMPGFSSHVVQAMAAADLLVLPSTNEGMAWVLLEAAASGLPAVATDVSGARHAVDHGRSGLIVPPCDPGGMARAVQMLMADPERRRAMGLRARMLAEERFAVDRMLDQLTVELFA
jgi:glycosyltransferase involved in cell wall biosynthesis